MASPPPFAPSAARATHDSNVPRATVFTRANNPVPNGAGLAGEESGDDRPTHRWCAVTRHCLAERLERTVKIAPALALNGLYDSTTRHTLSVDGPCGTMSGAVAVAHCPGLSKQYSPTRHRSQNPAPRRPRPAAGPAVRPFRARARSGPRGWYLVVSDPHLEG